MQTLRIYHTTMKYTRIYSKHNFDDLKSFSLLLLPLVLLIFASSFLFFIILHKKHLSWTLHAELLSYFIMSYNVINFYSWCCNVKEMKGKNVKRRAKKKALFMVKRHVYLWLCKLLEHPFVKRACVFFSEFV